LRQRKEAPEVSFTAPGAVKLVVAVGRVVGGRSAPRGVPGAISVRMAEAP